LFSTLEKKLANFHSINFTNQTDRAIFFEKKGNEQINIIEKSFRINNYKNWIIIVES
jgi:hypothetical protein